MKHKKVSFIILGIISVLCLAFFLFQISKSRTFQFFGGLTARVKTNQKVVALTFDDAPTPYTNEVLSILKKNNVKATFYAIGKNIESDPQTTQAIIRAGHEVGSHTFSHERMVLKSPSFMQSEIQKTNFLIRQAGYKGEITFRPPNGKKLLLLPWYLNSIGMKTIMWDIEPDTYFQGNSKKITQYTIDSVKPGSIILLHPFCSANCQADREALPHIIEGLQSNGYTFVTVSELLQMSR